MRNSVPQLLNSWSRVLLYSTGHNSGTAVCSPGNTNQGQRRNIASRGASIINPSDPKDPGYVFQAPVGEAARRDFMTTFPDLVRDLAYTVDKDDHADLNKQLSIHLSKCIQYNVPGGKKNRGYTVPATYRLLTPAYLHTEENFRLANILGWCVEFLQAYLLVADDIMDGSETRRGKPCWYKKDDLGLIAFNDGILLETCIYSLLGKYFRDQPYYTSLLESMLETTRLTAMGQALDLLSAHHFNQQKGKPGSLASFDMTKYNAIVKYKTSYYSFFLPVALAMNMAGIKDAELFKQSKRVLLQMGRFFQVQDDYLDCFGNPAVSGKVGTDIQDGKCSWLIVIAMQRANPAMKKELEENYGLTDPAKVERVKEIYRELQIPKIYEKYEEESYEEIQTGIQQTSASKGLPHDVFTTTLDRIYKRTS